MENINYFLPLFTVYIVFIFLISVTGVTINSILDGIFQFYGKSIVYLYLWLKWIQIRIRQNDADPTGSGSTSPENGKF
jgi:hypothetical protein